MTVPSTTRKAGPYTGNGAQTVFPFSFKVFSVADVKVVSADLTGAETVLSSGYTVSRNADQVASPGGSITMSAALANGYKVTVLGNLPYDQTLAIPGGGNYNPVAHENALDRIVEQIQQLAEALTRKFGLSATTTTNATLPAPSTGSAIGWDSLGNLVNIVLSAGTSLVDLAASAGSALIGYLPAGTGAVATTVQAELRLLGVFVENFGAVGNGFTDDTAAINAAMTASNGFVFLDDAKTYKITSQLVVPSTCKGIIGKGMYTSVLSKAFNGDLIKCDTNGAVFRDFAIVGNGATYTGGGIRPRGYNILIQHCRIADTADCPIIVEDSSGANTLAATYLRVDSCFLQGTSAATYAARLVVPNGSTQGADASANPTVRVFSNITGGANLIDFSGMNHAILDKSLGNLIKVNSSSAKINISGGNRFTNAAASIVIYGQDHVIDGNFWGFGAGQSLTIDSTATNVTFGPNNPISIGSSFNQSVSQNQAIGLANANTVYSKLQANPTLPWLGSGTNPTIGNGSFVNYYEQDGRLCSWQMEILTGSTTNVGSGNYSFQLPFKALVSAYGPCQVKSSSGTYYAAQFVVQGGASVGTISLIGITPALFASTSMALAAGSLIQAQVAYQIAAS